jgi:beta-galactosidase beta subunit
VIKKALQAVAQQDPHTLPPGKYTVDGDNLFFTVVEGRRARCRSSARNFIVSILIFILSWRALR